MAQRGISAGSRAETWAGDGAAGRPVVVAPRGFADRLQSVRARLVGWCLVDVAPGRLVPWLPVAFGIGVVLYFTANHEPLTWAPVILVVVLAAAAIVCRARPIGFPVLVGLTAMASGFATATLKTHLIAHPVLNHAVSGATIAGWVEVHEERERTDRIIVRVDRIDAPRLEQALERVRVSVRKGTAPTVGAFVEFKARLSPPLAPLRPGSYNFARDLYFQGIGATGLVSGTIKVIDPSRPPAMWVRYLAFMERLRDAVDRRIRGAVPGDAGSIASALITGKQDAISTPVSDALYVSSLAHVLSISGYHMAVVAGVVFFVVRGLMATVPSIALRRPIKKWAALIALAAAAFYLFLSGAQVATQRSFYMIAIVLVGVLFDRTAVTFRTLAIAAMAVLLLAPEAVVHPSFQMSFAATLALVAGYQYGVRFKHAGSDTPLGARIALWGANEVVSLLFASLLAGTATTPYAAYHFHRMAPYGALANLLAMPVVSAIVMPAGLAALLLMPFGLDGALWKLMELGLNWMDGVALWVAHLPGAIGRVAQFGAGPLIMVTLGLLILCLLRSPLRWWGAMVIALACLWALWTPQPEVLIAQSGDPVAVRGADGTLAIIRKNGDSFAVREWLASDADSRMPADLTLSKSVACDDIGCVTRLADGAMVSLALSPEAFADDCRLAVLIVSYHKPPRDCTALVIDRSRRAQTGALALRRVNARWETTPVRPEALDRPWAPAMIPRSSPAAEPMPVAAVPSSAGRPAIRDATPNPADLEPGDQ